MVLDRIRIIKIKGLQMPIEEKILKSAKQTLRDNKVIVSNYNGGLSYSDFGNASISLNISMDISHIDNFYKALQKLTDYRDSPIADDGYTGTDIHEPYGTDAVYFIMEYGYIFEDHRDTSLSILKENCDDKMVDDIIKKADHLYSLGFGEIAFSYSYFMQEQFQKRVEEEANEISAGYYKLEDEEILKIKYKILGIK